MGFYVTLASDGLAIRPGHDADVLRHIQAWSRKKLESHPTAIAAIARAKTPADAFEQLGLDVERDGRGRLSGLDYDGKAGDWFFELGALWAGIDPHMVPGTTIEITTEDDADDDEPEVIKLGNAARTGDRDDDNDEAPAEELDFE